MELFTDLKNRLAFRSGGVRGGSPAEGLWERLITSEEFLVAVIERSGMIESANMALCRLREAERKDVVGTSLPYLLKAEDRTLFLDLVRSVFGGAQVGSGQARVLTATDRSPAVHWVLLPQANGEGEVEQIYCLGIELRGELGGGLPESVAAELGALREAVADLERENGVLKKDSGVGNETSAASDPVEEQVVATVSIDQIPGLEGGGQAPTLAELERRYIVFTLEQTAGRVSGAKGAAAILGLHPNTLRSRMAKLGIVKHS